MIYCLLKFCISINSSSWRRKTGFLPYDATPTGIMGLAGIQRRWRVCVWVLLDSWRSGQHEGQAFMPICLKRDGRSSVDNDHINKGQKMQSLTLLQNDMHWKKVLRVNELLLLNTKKEKIFDLSQYNKKKNVLLRTKIKLESYQLWRINHQNVCSALISTFWSYFLQ